MKKLLIHNQDTVISDNHIFKIEEQFVFQIDDDFSDVDYYITYILDGVLKEFILVSDILFIRLSLSVNYLEYLGIRLAYHIRLTKGLEEKRFIPIVLVGEESYQFLGLTSELSDILFTEGIYLMRDTKEEVERFDKLFTEGRIKSLSSEKNFLEKTRVNAPANYSSHHSISNEWSIIRWAEMGSNISEMLKEDIYKKNTTSKTLYFKYLEAKHFYNNENPRQQFSKNKRESLLIPFIEHAKIYYVDDEAIKGWGKLFVDGIFKNFAEKGTFDYYKGFKKGEKKDLQFKKLTQEVIRLIRDEKYNVFIVDLKLFDEDFLQGAYPSGLELISEIVKVNPGVQIVVFTASKKAENIQKARGFGIDRYVLKESPENVLTRAESKDIFIKFSTAVTDACNYSVLTDVYSEIFSLKKIGLFLNSNDVKEKDFYESTYKKGGLLDRIFDLLKSKDKSLIEFALLTCFSILDKLCLLKYDSTQDFGKVILLNDELFCHFRSNSAVSVSTSIIFQRGNYSYEIIKDGLTNVSATFSNTLQSRSKPQPGSGTGGLIMLLAVLKYRYNTDDTKLNKVMEMKFLRNCLAGHDLGKVDRSAIKVKITDIQFLLSVFKEIADIENIFSISKKSASAK